MKTEVGRREQWTREVDNWPKDALGPFPPSRLSLGVPQGPRLQDPHQETRLSGKGASQYWRGAGEGSRDEEEGQLLALFPAAGGWSWFLALSPRSPWGWEEEELEI